MKLRDYGKWVRIYSFNNRKPVRITVPWKNATQFTNYLLRFKLVEIYDFLCDEGDSSHYTNNLRLDWWPNQVRDILRDKYKYPL